MDLQMFHEVEILVARYCQITGNFFNDVEFFLKI